MISESVKSLVRLDNEKVDGNPYIKELERLKSISSKLGSAPIIWRGMNLNGYGGIYDVVEDRGSYRGKIDAKVDKVINALTKHFNFKSKNPTFATFEKDKAKFFGSPHILIPTSTYQAIQHKDVDDILSYIGSDVNSNKEAVDIIKGYKKSISKSKNREVILDAKNYVLFSYTFINKILPQSMQVSVPKTYKDLADMLGKLIWVTKKRSKK
tara:strand:- start:678 stop:1310 length:633 start_codon:yes stop_codon:yes gene_type:complete